MEKVNILFRSGTEITVEGEGLFDAILNVMGDSSKGLEFAEKYKLLYMAR